MPRKATSKPQQISASQLAAEMLEMRLKVVRTNMKAVVARWKKDDEHLHELRISLRRAIASLDLFAPCCHPVKDVRWLVRKLKAVLKSTSRARDLDVLLSRPLPKSGKAGNELRKTWISDRKKAQKSLERHYVKLIDEKKLRQHAQSLLKSTRKSDKSPDTHVDPYAWSMLQLHNRLQHLLQTQHRRGRSARSGSHGSWAGSWARNGARGVGRQGCGACAPSQKASHKKQVSYAHRSFIGEPA